MQRSQKALIKEDWKSVLSFILGKLRSLALFSNDQISWVAISSQKRFETSNTINKGLIDSRKCTKSLNHLTFPSLLLSSIVLPSSTV
ncbi:hypothetical protein R3W88_029259 [Solanum pinnatisectum]|uniref:Maturase K n=1 Tax=Solanum pinnatisectum TaxID=50273 RepID=A0AAV9K6S0_9SOLN|nr:hypothetical protein R3W88_029259 [Solanum pinnatisectum]